MPALCDVLWLYANTNTYFTPSESYKKCTGDNRKIRKCDVRGVCQPAFNEAGEQVLNVVD